MCAGVGGCGQVWASVVVHKSRGDWTPAEGPSDLTAYRYAPLARVASPRADMRYTCTHLLPPSPRAGMRYTCTHLLPHLAPSPSLLSSAPSFALAPRVYPCL